jgi:gluconokinase
MVIVVMGVTASGKTVVGEALARRLEWVFADADDYHSPANRQKMHAGIPLDDEDRGPWLMELNELIDQWIENGINGVLACSALKQEYRDLLTADLPDGEVQFVFLDGPRALIEQRAKERHHAFATAALVASQFDTLEPPADALRVELEQPGKPPKPVDEIVQEILQNLHIKSAQEWHAAH